MAKENGTQEIKEERRVERERKDLENRKSHLFFNPIFPSSAPQNSLSEMAKRELNHNLELSEIRAAEEARGKTTKCIILVSEEDVLKKWLKNLKKEIIEKSQKESLAVDINVAIKSYRDWESLRNLTTDIVVEGLASDRHEIRDLCHGILEGFILSPKPFGCTLWLKALNREEAANFSLTFWKLIIEYYPKSIGLGVNDIISRDIMGYAKRNPEVKTLWENAKINPLEKYSSKVE